MFAHTLSSNPPFHSFFVFAISSSSVFFLFISSSYSSSSSSFAPSLLLRFFSLSLSLFLETCRRKDSPNTLRFATQGNRSAKLSPTVLHSSSHSSVGVLFLGSEPVLSSSLHCNRYVKTTTTTTTTKDRQPWFLFTVGAVVRCVSLSESFSRNTSLWKAESILYKPIVFNGEQNVVINSSDNLCSQTTTHILIFVTVQFSSVSSEWKTVTLTFLGFFDRCDLYVSLRNQQKSPFIDRVGSAGLNLTSLLT